MAGVSDHLKEGGSLIRSLLTQARLYLDLAKYKSGAPKPVVQSPIRLTQDMEEFCVELRFYIIWPSRFEVEQSQSS